MKRQNTERRKPSFTNRIGRKCWLLWIRNGQNNNRMPMRVSKRPFAFHGEIWNLELYHWLFKMQNFKVIPKRSLIFANKLKNLKLHSNFHLFFWPWNRKFEFVLKRLFAFWLQTTKIELNYLLFQWAFNNLKKPNKTIS